MKILIVDDDESTLAHLENLLANEGYETLTAAGGEAALALFIEYAPALVITDILMPEMDGLELLSAIRERSAETIVIMNTILGSERHAVKALRSRANDYLHKPVDPPALLRLIRKYASSIETGRRGRQLTHCIDRRELVLNLDNCLDLVPEVALYLAGQAGGVLSSDDLPMIRLGLIELITNAIEHGNLGVGKAMKTTILEAWGDYRAFLQERQRDPRLGRRQVTIHSRIDRETCEWVITDEGEGFDWRALPLEFSSETLFDSHGRGVLLSRLQFDELQFFGAGNVVRVKKRVGALPARGD